MARLSGISRFARNDSAWASLFLREEAARQLEWFHVEQVVMVSSVRSTTLEADCFMWNNSCETRGRSATEQFNWTPDF
jgi:hypothetical protein